MWYALKIALARGTGQLEMLSPSAPTCKTSFSGGKIPQWGSTVVWEWREDRGREGEFIQRQPVADFLKGHSLFEAPP